MIKRILLSLTITAAVIAGAVVPAMNWWNTRSQMDILFGHRKLASFGIVTKVVPGGLNVSIASDVPTPIQAGQSFTLTATLSVDTDTPNLNLRWHIPPSVKVISGNELQTFSATGGQPLTGTITLQAPDDKNYKIFAQVHHQVAGLRGEGGKRGNVAQFNTNPALLAPVHQHSQPETQGIQKLRGGAIRIVQ